MKRLHHHTSHPFVIASAIFGAAAVMWTAVAFPVSAATAKTFSHPHHAYTFQYATSWSTKQGTTGVAVNPPAATLATLRSRGVSYVLHVSYLNADPAVYTGALKNSLASGWSRFVPAYANYMNKKYGAKPTVTTYAKSGYQAAEMTIVRRVKNVRTTWHVYLLTKDKKRVYVVAEKWTKQTAGPFAASVKNIVTSFRGISAPGSTYRGDLSSKIAAVHIPLTGVGTQGLDIDPKTGWVYLSNNGSVVSSCDPNGVPAEGGDTLSIVNPTTKKEVARVATDRAPIWPLVDVDHDEVYVASSSGTVAVHQRGSGQKDQSIAVGGLPHMSARLGNVMVVSNTYDQSQTYYSAIDVGNLTVLGHHPAPRLPHPIVVNPGQKVAYMMGVEDGTVAVINMETGAPSSTFQLSGAGGQLWWSKKFNKFYASSSQNGASAVAFHAGTKQSLGTITFAGLGAPGTSVTVDESGELLFVVIQDKHALGIASAKTLRPLGYIKTEGCPYGVRLDAARGVGYVSNSGGRSVTMFNLNKVRAAVQ